MDYGVTIGMSVTDKESYTSKAILLFSLLCNKCLKIHTCVSLKGRHNCKEAL